MAALGPWWTFGKMGSIDVMVASKRTELTIMYISHDPHRQISQIFWLDHPGQARELSDQLIIENVMPLKTEPEF